VALVDAIFVLRAFSARGFLREQPGPLGRAITSRAFGALLIKRHRTTTSGRSHTLAIARGSVTKL